MPSSVPDRLIRTKSDEVAVDEGCWFDQSAADRVRAFFERFLRHSKGQFAGQRFELLPWQWERVVEPAFGWKMPDGTRRFNRVAVGVPKKNGKSTLLAGLGLYLLVSDGEPGAEVYSAAGDRKQASIIYNEAAQMVAQSPALSSRVRVRRAVKQMEYGSSTYEALSSEAYTKEGINTHGLLFDELHTQPSHELWDTLRYSGASRRQPMICWISTAGVDREGICYMQWRRAVDVQESRAVDVGLLPCIYETPEDADPWAEETWRAVNPSYGVTISERDMREAAKEAREAPIKENTFRRYRLNQWTRQETRWLPVERWERCAGTFRERDLRGQRCWAGGDLSSTGDLTALTLLFRDGVKYRTFSRFWAPEAALRARERSNRQRIDHWAKAGLITLTPGNVVDYKRVLKDICDLAARYRIREVALDPWNADSIAADLQGEGFKVEYVRQGFASMSPAMKAFERMVSAGEIEHDGNPVMTWMFGNLAVKIDPAGNIKPDKSKAAEKIDGPVSLVIALARAIKAQQPKAVARSGRLQVI